MNAEVEARASRGGTRSANEVFRAFLKLGFVSFCGTIAHLGYFRDELVVRRTSWVVVIVLATGGAGLAVLL